MTTDPLSPHLPTQRDQDAGEEPAGDGSEPSDGHATRWTGVIKLGAEPDRPAVLVPTPRSASHDATTLGGVYGLDEPLETEALLWPVPRQPQLEPPTSGFVPASRQAMVERGGLTVVPRQLRESVRASAWMVLTLNAPP